MLIALLLVGGALYGLRARAESAARESRADSPRSAAAGAIAAPDDPQPTRLTVSPQSIVETEKQTEKQIDKYLTISAGSLGLAVGGALFYAPLSILSGILNAYTAVPFFRRAYHAIFKERRLRAAILGAVSVTGALVGGFFVVSAFGASIYYLGRKLLLKTEDQSRRKLINIFGEQQRFAWLWQNGVEVETAVEELQPGDLIVVSAGQLVPVDGVIREGAAAIDQHTLTGEAQPVERGVGERVFASTLVLAGRVYIEVQQTGAASVVAQIGEMLNQTADYRAEIEFRSEKLADQAVLPILSLGALALGTVGAVGAVAVLSSNFTENYRVAVPLSMLNYINKASKEHILIKDGRALELLGDIDTVIFDKTGTLTVEQPAVEQVHTCLGITADTLLTYAATAEAKQSHPIARAIRQAAADRALRLPKLDQVSYAVGYGIAAEITGRQILVGSARFMAASNIPMPAELAQKQAEAHALGYSLVYVAVDGQLGGALELRPTVRAELAEVIATLHRRGLTLYIISGDHEEPTRRIAAQLGITHYFAEVLPANKAALVKKLQQEGRKVCFVGDGINDSIALKTANASISLCGATTAATDTAQIILMDGTLRQLPTLFALAADFAKNVRVSLATTFVPALLCVGGVFFLNFGIFASVMFFNISLIASVGNAMLPALQREPKPRPEPVNLPRLHPALPQPAAAAPPA